MKLLHLVVLVGLALFIGCKTPTSDSDHDIHIQNIENDLLPSIAIEGEESPIWSIANRMAHYNVPGVSIAFFDQGEIQWTRSYGYLNLDSIKQVNEHTVFQAASISKPVAALAAMSLVEDGLLDIDQPVNDFLNDWQIPDNGFTEETKINFRHLITHTGGLTVHGFRGYAADEEVPDVIQILDGSDPANSDPVLPDTLPGSIWRYSGGGYTVAQKVMEDISGMPFNQILNDHVLEHAGMSNSTYEQPLPETYHENAAMGYRSNGDPVVGNWHTYPEQAAAGLWTTPSDLAKMAISVQRAYMGSEEEIISSETAKAILTKHKGDWGLGFGLDGEMDSLRFGHGGANEGYRCNLLAFANLGQGVAIMTNGDNGGNLYSEILRSLSKEYEWNVFNQEIKQVKNLTSEQINKVAGNYKYVPDESFSIKIEIQEGDLILNQLWNHMSYPILPEDDLLFFDKNDGTPFQFVTNETGLVVKVVVDGGFELVKSD